MSKRAPNHDDLLALTKALADLQVEYVLISGAAMALFGFPRMTKDIGLLLPINPQNNGRLLEALAALPNNAKELSLLKKEWLDQGFSTALEAEINIYLLFVAAGKNFEDLRAHIHTVLLDGIPIKTLDVDGMLLTKQTNRESDIPDCSKLRQLRESLAKKHSS